MGTDCHAILEVGTRPPSLAELLGRLDRLNPSIADWWPSAMPGRRARYHPDVDVAWQVEDRLSDDHEAWLTGSRGLLIQWCQRAAVFPAGLRWRTFLNEPEQRLFTRRVARAIARAFDGRRVLYVPDNMWLASGATNEVYLGGSAADAEAWLRTNCGPPRFAGVVPTPPDGAGEPPYLVDDLDVYDPELDH